MVDNVSVTLSKEIRHVAEQSTTEEDLKIGVQKLLDDALIQLGVTKSLVKFEKKIYKSRRADALYPAVAIEYKRPHALNNESVINQATNELSDYLKGLSRSEEISRKVVGIALDGYKILFIRARGTSSTKSKQRQLTLEGAIISEPDIEKVGPLPINEFTVEQLLTYLRQLNRRILDAQTLANDFGSKSTLGRNTVNLLHKKLFYSKNPKTAILFKEWNRIFGIVYGENIIKATKEASKLASEYNLTENLELKSILFSIHTYYALLMKMLAAEVLAMQHEGLLASFANGWKMADDNELKKNFEGLESGGLFKKFGIKNFLEGDFFSWYLEEWDNQVSDAIRNIAKILSEYEPATAKLENEQVKDLLKKLYQYLVPKTIRHDLGEYYTPDWLAEYLISKLEYDGDSSVRFLDPACGSGTFLTLLIKKINEFVEERPEKHSGVLENILKNIVGFDINPIAVLSARTNFLIAISPLRRLGEGEIEIPIYQADSVLTPRTYATLDSFGSYTVKTVVGDFRISQLITDKETIEKILDHLDDVTSHDGTVNVFLKRVKDDLKEDLYEKVKQDLEELFDKVEQLKIENRNHIWARILKNNFAPLSMGKFDFVIGNPPWIRWGYLSEDYRKATLPMWKGYGLFSLKGMEARLGSGEKDFSMLFLYVCADSYLKENGKLAFLITQEAVKSKGAGEGFRRFQLGSTSVKLMVKEFHDLVTLQPFEGAGNKTGLIIIQKNKETQYPIPYFKLTNQSGIKIETEMSLPEVLSYLTIEERNAFPVKGLTGSWQDVPISLNKGIKKIKGQSFYKAYRGVSIEPYGVLFINIIKKMPKNLIYVENLPELGKKNIHKVNDVIESQLVFPIVRGSDIEKWNLKPKIYSLIVQDPHTRKGFDESWMLQNLPKTYDYLKRFETELLQRKGYWKYFSKELESNKKLELTEIRNGKYKQFKEKRDGKYIYEYSDAPFYTMFNVSDYTFAKYKVIWSRMSNDMKAVVASSYTSEIGEKKVIGTDTTSLIPFQDKNEAHFVCALLNSSVIRYFIRTYSSGGRGFGAPSMLESVNIPQYNEKNPVHKELTNLSVMAHNFSQKNNHDEVERIEKSINKLVAKMFKLNKYETKTMSS